MDSIDFVFPGIPERSILMIGAGLTHTNIASAEAEVLTPRFRTRANLLLYRDIRLLVGVGTSIANSGIMYVKYSTGGAFSEFAATNLPQCSLSTLGFIDSGWITIPAGAKTDNTILAIFTKDGDGAADPVTGNVYVLLR